MVSTMWIIFIPLIITQAGAFILPYHLLPTRAEKFDLDPKPQPIFASRLSVDAPLVSSVGEADRALRQAVILEKAGLTRAAAAAYHEAATLYQCFLDTNDSDSSSFTHNNAFSHVTGYSATSNPKNTTMVAKVLAYTCIQLAHLSNDGLGDAKAAARLYRDVTLVDPSPTSIAFDGMGTCIEGAGGNLKEAISAYRRALSISPDKSLVLLHLAVALERLGQGTNESEEIMERLRRSEAAISCLVDSWGYVRWHTRRIPRKDLNLYRGLRSMLQIGIDASMPLITTNKGLVCEFGVGNGRSLRMIQEMLPLDYPIHGFDTFTGTPTRWNDEPAGSHSTGGVLPTLEGDIYFHRGLFKDTIPTFVESLTEEYRPLAFANIDCDLYGSTLDILESIYSRVVPGTVFVFDKYLCHATWRQDEFRAWRECCKRFGWQYEYLGFSLGTKQAVLRVTSA